ncbi:hypothetical protein NECAME_03585 [Necator americanus]|uniref:Ephrin RBD domain-containing protein n=1 Tax=Necator americanus TaxID=51031 RepID=W2T382_NECAM|nr:hypothetical protein NECAME_03585 [Necator americanus]ETN76019.1 hypothetical protein NECAME_03585 [Necator americanus]
MFIVRPSNRGCSNPWDSFRIVFFIIIMLGCTNAATKKAIVEWFPNGRPFRDPMLDHTALVELHLLDRIVFVCDTNIPAVIYRVSEESFDECKYDLSAEWIGECSAGTKYITVTLRSINVVPTQPVYYANVTYFFTSFSSGTHAGIHEKGGALCLMGVRMIVSLEIELRTSLEVRGSSKRVPLLPRSFTSEFEQLQVPVQRVSYGGRPEQKQHNLDFTTESSTKRDYVSYSVDKTLFSNPNEIEWDTLSPEYFNYSSASSPTECAVLAILLSLFII